MKQEQIDSRELDAQISNYKRLRDRTLGEVGLKVDEVGDGMWLLTGCSPEILSDWEQKLQDLLGRPLEDSLELIPMEERIR